VNRRHFVKAMGAVGAAGVAGNIAAWPAGEARAEGARRAPRSESQAAFRELLATLAEIDEGWLVAERGVREADIPLAHRALGMVLSGALDLYLEADPERPHFTRLISPFRKWGDNPDGIYFFTSIRGDRRYRIRGRRGAEVYLSFTVHGGDAEGHWPKRVVADMNLRDMTFGPDGSYEVVLDAQKPSGAPGNWMALAPDAGSVVARFYFLNETPAAADPTMLPELSIEPEGSLVGAPSPPDDAMIAARYRRVANWLRSKYGGQLLRTPGRKMPSWNSTTPNQIGSPLDWSDSQGGGWGAVDIVYAAGPWQLEADEALVIEGRMPKCLFASVVLWNPFGQTADYRYRTVSLNKVQMELAEDGGYRVVVANTDPGVPNWLDTAGRREGTVFWRFMLPEESPGRLDCRVVKTASLAGAGTRRAKS